MASEPRDASADTSAFKCIYKNIKPNTRSKQEFWLPYPLSKLPPTSSFSVNSYFIKPVALGKHKHHARFPLFSRFAHIPYITTSITFACEMHLEPTLFFPSQLLPVTPGPINQYLDYCCVLFTSFAASATTCLLQSILCPAASEALQTKQNSAARHC